MIVQRPKLLPPGNAYGRPMTDTPMTDTNETLDYSKTLNLPQTDFPMRAGLPEKEPLLVQRWQQICLLYTSDAADE